MTYNTSTNVINNTSTDVISEFAWCNRVVAKQEGSHSTTLADKHVKEYTPNRFRLWRKVFLFEFDNYWPTTNYNLAYKLPLFCSIHLRYVVLTSDKKHKN